MTRGFAFDVQAVCSGFIYALATADNFIKAGQAKTALVIGAETFSRILDWTDRTTCVLFADGAGALVLKAEEGRGDNSDRGDRKSVVEGKSVSVRVALGGRRIIKKQNNSPTKHQNIEYTNRTFRN